MIETVCSVLSNEETAPGYRLLVLTLDDDLRVGAGQFAMLKPSAGLEPLLRRALAVYRAPGPREISFLYQVLGRGTEALSRLGAGDKVDVLIPLGNTWPIPSAATSSAKRALVVAGGIGSASILMLCEQLRSSGIDSVLLFGAATKTAAIGCGLNDLETTGLPMLISTDDGSLGEQGLVTAPFERLLSQTSGDDTVVYTCGPWAMMRRVAEIAAGLGASCYASLEAPMACGFGVCVGCVVAVNAQGHPGYHSYKRVCVEGSIFPASMIRWEVNAMAH
jgi:dihydroorotate dehydrogenase electron transfer subunit